MAKRPRSQVIQGLPNFSATAAVVPLPQKQSTAVGKNLEPSDRMKGVSKKQAGTKRREPMKAYSQDLRERVLRAVDQGYQRADIIKLFGVSRATIKRYLKQRRETGAVNVKPIPGRPPKKFAPLQAHLVAQLEAHPDATLEAHCQMWQEQQAVAVSTSTMSRAIRRVGWTRKKRRWAPLNATKRPEQPGENSSSIWMPASSSSSMSVAPTLV